MDSIEKFFLPPCDVADLDHELLESGERPVLHLLRRDLEHLYLKENLFSPTSLRRHKAPYLAAMGIFTGIDLMAKFYSEKGMSGEVFKKFFIEVCGESFEDAEFAWEFRNALHHSYSLSLRFRKNTIFTTAINGDGWHTCRDGIHCVNLWGLKKFFLLAVEKYKAKIYADELIKNRFLKRYGSAGRIFVAKQEKRPYNG